MIDKIDILHKGHCGYFTGHSSEKSAGLLCVVPYHHKVIVELGENGLDSLAKSFVSPRRRPPVLLIQPKRNLKRYLDCLKKIPLNLCADIPFVSEHQAVMIFPSHIVKVLEVVYTCRCHVIGMDHAPYPAHGVELIAIIMQALRCAIAPVGSGVDVVTPHDATIRPCPLTHFDRFGINAEHIFRAIYRHSHILSDFFGKPCRKLTPGIELPTANQVWQILLAFIVQTVKQEILAVKGECLRRYAQGDDFKVGELRDNAASGYVSAFIYTILGEILADFEDSDEICYEVAHKQCDST